MDLAGRTIMLRCGISFMRQTVKSAFDLHLRRHHMGELLSRWTLPVSPSRRCTRDERRPRQGFRFPAGVCRGRAWKRLTGRPRFPPCSLSPKPMPREPHRFRARGTVGRYEVWRQHHAWTAPAGISCRHFGRRPLGPLTCQCPVRMRLGHSGLPRRQPTLVRYISELRMVPRGGIEPPTLRFSVACSTN
jgi:hypothetical protein